MTLSQTSNYTDTTTVPQDSAIYVGIDIGSTKVCVIIARSVPNVGVNIIGLGTADSNNGVLRGVIVNIENTTRAIQQAIEKAQQMSGVQVKSAVVGISGDHIQVLHTKAVITTNNPNREITRADVQRLMDDSQQISLSSDRKILHTIPQSFVVDGQDGIKDPVGMSGLRVDADVHLVTAAGTNLQNIYRCCERAGIEVSGLVLEPIASAAAVLDEEEKDVGVAIIDIGGGTTDIAIYHNNVIRLTSSFGIAGKQVTDDIRAWLGITYAQAEKIKRDFGHCIEESIVRDEHFPVIKTTRTPVEISKSELCRIIQPRMEEIFEFVWGEISRSNMAPKLSGGIVITGGTANLRGADLLAQHIFGISVKLGIPNGIAERALAPEAMNPMYATAVGLILYAIEEGKKAEYLLQESVREEIPIRETSSYINSRIVQPKVQQPIKQTKPTNQNNGNFIKKVVDWFTKL
ncbi:MAG: cell division protein FtsA [Candidatus Kapabacteria bacterium]|nr:cell division protein FtsA [Candidatus Kapabacteria bacterium]